MGGFPERRSQYENTHSSRGYNGTSTATILNQNGGTPFKGCLPTTGAIVPDLAKVKINLAILR
ncbi:hypothetical protein NHP21011_08030 [Helicobacter heilmannii]|nr:hypothetical protein NHP21011_08030 [Helicobacter heilmannii]